MFILQLNDIRSPKYETLTPVARADSVQELIQLMELEKVERYFEDPWNKDFRKGSSLEWFNPPKGEVHTDGSPYILDVGDAERWAEQARADFETNVMRIPEVKTLTAGRNENAVELKIDNQPGLGPVV
jgi:hypothetical protein